MSTVACPLCQQQYPFNPALVGKKVRCSGCKQVFPFPAEAAAAPQPALQPLAGPFGFPDPVPSSPSYTPTAAFNQPQQFGLATPTAPNMQVGYAPLPATSVGTFPTQAANIPAHYGQVVRQFAYGPRPLAVFILVPVSLLLSLGMAALLASGQANQMTFRRIPVPHLLYVLIPFFFVLAIALAGMLLASKTWPKSIFVTTLGVYFPRNSLFQSMVFVPFSDRPAMHVEEYNFGFMTAADIRLKGPKGSHAIPKGMLLSDAEFYELASLLKSQLPFT